MNELLRHLVRVSRNNIERHPYNFDLSKSRELAKFNSLLKKKANVTVVDDFKKQLEELFLTRHPELKTMPKEASAQAYQWILSRQKKSPLWQQGKWIYFDWSNTLIHTLEENDFFELITSRNRDLIRKEEQNKLRKFRVGIAGLSVGNSVALALALEGVTTLRLADFDLLSLSNLNRIRAGTKHLGMNKALITAEQLYELNPYAKLELFEKGLGNKDIKKFLTGPPRLDVIIDEMDDLVMKIKLRLLARSMGIPVVSATDNGDGILIDIERFDKTPKRQIFHGFLGNNINIEAIKKMNFGARIKLINKIVGVNYVTQRMKMSLLKVGLELYAWPQLGGAAMLCGSATAYIVKKIALDESLRSGKYDVNLDRMFTSNYDSARLKKKRQKETNEFLRAQDDIFGEPGRTATITKLLDTARKRAGTRGQSKKR